MGKESILVVEDENEIRELIRYNLAKEGYEVIEAKTGVEALTKAHGQLPALVLLDLMLPELDALEAFRRLKRDYLAQHVPVVMLTAKGEESDIVSGLEVGADDYITKPFSPRVLIARVRAVLRRGARNPVAESDTIHVHNIVIHLGRHEVLVGGAPVVLTNTEFRVLVYLARRPGWVFTRYQIVDAVHGEDYPVTERSVDVQIVGLRKKLGDAGKFIETVRGVGYRFRE